MSWDGGRLRVIDDGQSCALGGLLLSATMGNKQPAHMRRLFVSHGGTSEHPEELTDRCCLSALAGLSKYLPLLGAGGIIAFWSAMSTLGFEGQRTQDHVYKE